MSDEAFLLCIDNRGYAASLERRTVYRKLSDPQAEQLGMVRIVDETDEDYLFPAELFVPIAVPSAAVKAFSGAA
jgi:hypothetical protein